MSEAGKSRRHRTWIWQRALIAAVVLSVGMLSTWWMVHRADQAMRGDLLRETRLMAQSVNLARVQALSGTEADLDSADYLRLKEQLASAKEANDRFRFIYIMGRNAEGAVFFFVDNEAVGSENEAPAGMIYDDAPGAFLQVFDTAVPETVGPFTDQWGTFVSGAVPLVDPETGRVSAVLAMDIEASQWKWRVAADAALPAGLMLALLILLVPGIMVSWVEEKASVKPVQRRLLIPLGTAQFLLVGGFAGIMLHMQQLDLDESSQDKLAAASYDLGAEQQEQSHMLSAIGDALVSEASLIDGLKARDGEQLLREYAPLFTQFQARYGITHFYFHLPNRVNLLRVHKPERKGDTINRLTALEAERTGQTASGAELGPLGTFTLRVVLPVFEDATLIGYLELGKEIEDILGEITEEHGLELAVSIPKNMLDRNQWEAGMAMLGREADWDRFPKDALIYSSLPRFPTEFDRFVDELGHVDHEVTAETVFDGRSWRVLIAPLSDVSGNEVGDLIVLHDISAEKAAFHQIFVLSTVTALVLLTALLGSLSVLLRRTDQGIQAQHTGLAEKEARFRALYESTGDAIMTLDESGFSDCNPMTLAMFGCATKEEFCSLHPGDVSPIQQPDGSDSMTAANERIAVAMKKGSHRFEWLHKRSDTGESFPAEVLLSAMELGGKQLLQATVRDITERKVTEAERERLVLAIEQAKETIVITDAEGVIQYANPAFEVSTGYLRSEAIGQNPRVLKSGKHDDRFYTEMWETLSRGETWSGEIVNKKKDDTLYTEEATISPVRNSTGTIISFVAVKHDITERKQAEQQLAKNVAELTEAKEVALCMMEDAEVEREKANAARHEAEQTNEQLEEQTAFANSMVAEAEMANAAKSEILANMSHEIRTPMNGVIGMTGLLLDTDLTSEQRMFAETVRNSGDSLLGLINDILDFSKIEAGKLEMETLDFDLRSTLENFGDALAMRAHDKGLEFNCLNQPDVPLLLKGDPGRLRQILMNLTGNSVKFTEKGEIAVVVELLSEQGERVTLRFAVRDTGIGIPRNRREALFEAFTQVDGSTTRKYGGTGLGLTISKQLAEIMGGKIGVDSVEDEGSTFWFTAVFEKQPPGAQPPESLPRDIADRLAGVRVLAVDDNETSRLVVGGLLESWRFRHDEVKSGRSALEKLRGAVEEDDPYSVAILDMVMPEMDGEELGKLIKADPLLKETRLIMMTSFGKRGDAARMGKIGFEGYLPKPVKRSILFDCLATILIGKSHEKGKGPQGMVTRHSIAEDKRANARILLAEDNITNQQVALALLKKLGLSADAVANGAEAVNALKSIPYDLVIMDCQMPEMDGYEATGVIRNPESSVLDHEIPVIAMTAHAMQGDREKCIEAGMSDYLSKPVVAETLTKILDKWLPQKKDGKDWAIGEKDGRRDSSGAEVEDRTGKDAGDATNPVFDKAGMMERLMNDDDLARTIAESFLVDIPKQIQGLKDFLEAGDIPSVERQAHTIKGASANVGGEALRAVAFEMEMDGKAANLDAVWKNMSELEAQFDRLKDAMEKNL